MVERFHSKMHATFMNYHFLMMYIVGSWLYAYEKYENCITTFIGENEICF